MDAIQQMSLVEAQAHNQSNVLSMDIEGLFQNGENGQTGHDGDVRFSRR